MDPAGLKIMFGSRIADGNMVFEMTTNDFLMAYRSRLTRLTEERQSLWTARHSWNVFPDRRLKRAAEARTEVRVV